MAISAHTRKVLWSLSGNACARCDTQLVRAPEAVGDVHAIVGRECHIVAHAETGPRGGAGPRDHIDTHDNLILLCANCHAIIDGQTQAFPPATLRRIKAEHEQKVAQRSAPSALDFRLSGRERSVALAVMDSGDALIDILGPSFSFTYDRPDRMTREQRALVGPFLQSCQDWGDIYGEIGPQGHHDAGQDLQDGLDALRDEGLVVYAALRPLTLTDGSRNTRWPDAVVRIVHEHEARVPSAETAATR